MLLKNITEKNLYSIGQQKDVDENEDENEDEIDEWVQCETEECEKWYHIYCVNSNWPDKQVVDVNDIWHCCS